MWIGEIYNSKIDPRFRIEIGTSMHREILFLDDAEEFARNLLQKIETFRGPTLAKQFAKQMEAVETADAFKGDGEFKAELAQMWKLQKRITARLEAARAIVEELEPLVDSRDWRLMLNWVKKYGR